MFSSSEPPILPNQQPKKRRRKDLAKGNGDHFSGKQKSVKIEAAKVALPVAKNSTTSAQTVTVTGDDMKFQNQPNASRVGTKKEIYDSKIMLDTSFLHISNGDASALLAEAKDTDKQKTRILSKDTSSKFNDINVTSVASQLKYNDKSAYAQHKSQSIRPRSNIEELESTPCAREKKRIPQLPDLNIIEGNYNTLTIVSAF